MIHTHAAKLREVSGVRVRSMERGELIGMGGAAANLLAVPFDEREIRLPVAGGRRCRGGCEIFLGARSSVDRAADF